MVNAIKYTNGMQDPKIKCPDHDGVPADFTITQEQVRGRRSLTRPPARPPLAAGRWPLPTQACCLAVTFAQALDQPADSDRSHTHQIPPAASLVFRSKLSSATAWCTSRRL